MFCPKCGKETPDNQAFCASCGAPLTQAATPGAPAAVAAGISPKSTLITLCWELHEQRMPKTRIAESWVSIERQSISG